MPGISIVGGNIRYPNLQSIADLFRVMINDSMAGATNTPGEGLIMTNSNPDLLTILNEGVTETYLDLGNVGDPALLLDNYLLLGIPPLTATNPAVRVTLSYAGYNNGFTWNNAWTLPIGCESVLGLWERWSNLNGPFFQMQQVHALPGQCQGQRMGVWAMEQNAIVMPGCMEMVDLRLRCRIVFPEYLDPLTINFTNSYVPILSSKNAIAAKMRLIYATRFAPDQYQLAVAEEARQMDKLKSKVVRQQQSIANGSAPFGEEATGSMAGWWWSQL